MKSILPIYSRWFLTTLLCCLNWTILSAQQLAPTTLRGTITDADTRQPLPFANVYLNGTTRGTATDEQGRYTLTSVPPNTVELVVSYTGYTTEQRTIRPDSKSIDVALKPTTLQEVIVVAKRDKDWLRHAHIFEQELLGQSPFANQCIIVNDNVLSFTETNDNLLAQATQPLIIDNLALGYRITYQLQGFRFEPGRGAFYGGNAYFAELTPDSDRQARTWQRNRQQAYQGSLRHLLVAIQQNKVEDERFLVYQEDLSRPISPNTAPMLSNELGNHLKPFDATAAISPGPVAGERILNAPMPLVVFYTPIESRLSPYRDARYAYTQLVFPQRSIGITPSGLIVAPRGFEARGYLGNDRLANALPTDWLLDTPVARRPLNPLATPLVPALIRPADRRLDSLRTRWQAFPAQGGLAIFLHIDKPLYLTGEWLWLSAYALNRQTHQPDTTDRGPAVRVELWSPQQEMVSQQWVAVQLGRGASQVYLPDSLATGLYTLRAYTDADRKSPRPAFERTVSIVRATDKTNLITERKPAGAIEVQALPEGGQMVAGLPVRLGIKAVQSDGLGLAVSGRIVGSKGQELARFETNVLGMGSTELAVAPPRSETCTVEILSPRKTRFALAPSVVEGLVLRTQLSPDSARVQVRVNASASFAGRSAYLVAQSRGRVVEAVTFALRGSQADLSWPTTRFPAGLAQVTLYDSAGHPQAERLVFIPERRPAVAMRVTQTTFAGAAVQPGFSLAVSDGSPVIPLALLSVAVTNAEAVPADTVMASLPIHLLLAGDLRGGVEHPWIYFRDRSPQTYAALDNLLLTQGWRGITWQSTPTAPVAAPDIIVRGQVINLQNEPMTGMKLLLTVMGMRQWQAKETTTDRQGRFYIGGLVLTDSTQVRAQVSDASRRALKVKVLFDNNYAGFGPGLSISPVALPPATLATVISDGQQRQALWSSLYRQPGATLLKEVVVRSRFSDERPEDIRQRSLHDRVDQTILVTEETRAGSTSLYSLLSSIPGVSVLLVDNKGAMAYNVRIYSIGPTAGFSGINPSPISTSNNPYTAPQTMSNTFSNPLFLFDGFPIQDDDGRALLMFMPSEIERIEVLKTATTAMYGIRGNNGVIAFYTRRGGDNKVSAGAAAQYKLPGYAIRRDFFVTRYPATPTPEMAIVQDVLGWFPLAQTDKQGQFSFSLSLPKLPKNVRVTVQGITPSGDPIWASQVITTR